MTTEHAIPATLADQIAAFNEALAGKAPAEVLATFDREIEALVRSGIAASGLRAGVLAPDFTLPNVDGRPVTLYALLAQGPVVLTFYRGEWCPYCNLQLRAYQAGLPQIRALSTCGYIRAKGSSPPLSGSVGEQGRECVNFPAHT